MQYIVSHNQPTNTVNESNRQIIYKIQSVVPENGTMLNWKNIGTTNSRDFVGNQDKGTIVLTNSSATITLTVKPDKKLESDEDIIILFSNTITNQVLASSSIIKVKNSSNPSNLTVVLPNVPINSSPQNTINTVQDANVDIWATGDIIGELEMFETSELAIKSNISSSTGLKLQYEIQSGSLPPGLSLLPDGNIVGCPLDENTLGNTSTTYTFVASVSKNTGNPISTSTFSIIVNRQEAAVYTPVYLKPFLSKEKRELHSNFIRDRSIFKPDLIYKMLDPSFGVQREIKSYLHYAVERIFPYQFQDICDTFLYKRRFSLGFPKIAIAKDKAGNYIYDAIYSDVIDYNVNADGKSATNSFLFPVESFTYVNARKRLDERGFNRGDDTNRFNPRFMQTSQPGSLQELGFIPCVIWAYALPEKGNVILSQIKKYPLNFNEFDFEIDRFVVERSDNAQPRYFLFHKAAQYQ